VHLSVNRVGLVISSILAATAARAADFAADSAGALEEVIVTAQKRTENLQQVPASVMALDTRQMQQLHINDFDDYTKFLPSLSTPNGAPGQDELSIRGLTNGTDGLRVGSQPTVAVYLDEQPVTTIANNLDVHMYDIARVEELSGPQGTLFGSSSMGGTLRIITNKPGTDHFEAACNIDGNMLPGAGSKGGQIEGYVNVPVSAHAAVRLVAFTEHDGGYINNVPGPAEVWPTAGVPRSNAAFVEKNFNPVDTTGARGALRIDLDRNWTITPTAMGQYQRERGIPAYNPAAGDLNVVQYFPNESADRWWQAALTIEGRISQFDVVYAGGYIDRQVHTESDYSEYAFDYDVYFAAAPQYFGDWFRNDAGQLIPPAEYARFNDHYTKVSHELRLSSPQSWRLRFVAGLFLQHQIDDTRNEFNIDGLAKTYSITGMPGIYYLNDMSRVDRDRAAFGEIYFDVLPKLTLAVGGREFSYDNTVYGFFGFNGNPVYGLDYIHPSGEITCQPGSAAIAGPDRPCINVDQRAARSGSTYKVNLTWQVDSDRLLYGTWSTGFRPGGINRTRDLAPYAPDYLVNFEAGWKTEWLQHRLRFNGDLFYERWKNPQFAICGLNCVVEVINAGSARVRGVEGNLQWSVTPELTLTAAATRLDANLTGNACLFGNAGSLCRNADGEADPSQAPLARAGDPLPAPRFKGSLIARYSFPLTGFQAHMQEALSGQSATLAQPPGVNGGLQAGDPRSFTVLDLSAGLGRSSWEGELYVKNALDRRAQLGKGYPCGYPTCNQLFVLTNAPRLVGISFNQKF